MPKINVKHFLKYYTIWPSDWTLSSAEQFPYSYWYAQERLRMKIERRGRRDRFINYFDSKTPQVAACSNTLPACYLETGTSGQRDIEVLLNLFPQLPPVNYGWQQEFYDTIVNVMFLLKWQFTKLLMKCIANMLVSGWLGKLTAVYFPYCHINQHTRRIKSSFLWMLFKCKLWPVNFLVRTWGGWNQSFRKILWGFLESSLTNTIYPKPLQL